MPIFKNKNENFFKKWTPEMAYVFGFFCADGNLTLGKRNNHYIEFTSCDKLIIENIKKNLNSNISIGHSNPKNENHHKRYRIQIGSKIMFNDLLKMGMTLRKSKTIKLPHVPQKYFSHFCRGYFDGDGHVTISFYKRSDRDNKKYSTVISGFTSGSQFFLEKLLQKLKQLSHIIGGTLYYNKGYRLCFSVRDSLLLYKFLYQNLNNGICLLRKKRVFEKYFKI